MGKIAFVFSGQGAQRPGMGKEIYDASEAAKAVFDKLDTLREGTSAMCFEGSDEELMQTANTQPCLFAVEMAAAAALEEKGIKADMTAGFSLGEIAALTYSGAASLESGFGIVCRRGEVMQKAAEENPAAMAAILKLSNDEVEQICSGLDRAYPVNYNCTGQVTCAAAKETMPMLLLAAKAAGGRAVPLKVSGGFHSPFMESAAADFAEALKGFELNTPALPLYSNLTAEPYGKEIRDTLSRQICSPVKWEKLVRNMIEAGADTFIELGAGNTLVGLIGRIDPEVRTFCVTDKAGLDKAVSELAGEETENA